MSKAFTSEENEDEGIVELPPLPPGTTNYMTTGGAARLRSDIERLIGEQSRAGTDLAGQARAQELERRLRFLTSRLQGATVIDPRQQPTDRILFGATVTVEDPDHHSQVFRIVGLDEADPAQGWISWMSPLASALLNRRPGETVLFLGKSWAIRDLRYEA